ncbi:MAG: ATP-binding protein [Candidatus Dormibacteria bacterium]
MSNMTNEQLLAKWKPVLEHADLPKIKDPVRKLHCATLLENTEKAMKQEREQNSAFNGGMITETLPANFAGTGGYATAAAAGGPVSGFDPILISLIRRNMPVLMGYDVCGVQPMTGPTGLIFAMRSVYANAANGGATINAAAQNESLFQEANNFSGNTSLAFGGSLSGNGNPGGGNTAQYAQGGAYPNAIGEDLGGATVLQNMGFSIEKVTVTANTRGLQAGYTLELAQDLKAVHGLDAETELANILSTELLTEINREIVRTIYVTATQGAQLSNSAGTFDLTPFTGSAFSGDTYSRWQVEAYKGLVFQLERESNKIMKDVRRGKGNLVICSTDVGSALSLSGLLDVESQLSQLTGGVADPDDYQQGTFLGMLGKLKVFVDPYSVSGADYYVVGYRGTNAYDAGLFYCPYVPLQMVRAIDPNTYQPKIGFKTRYGVVANPFAEGYTQGLGEIKANSNLYYRKAIVKNLK